MLMKKEKLLEKKLHKNGYREMTIASGQMTLYYTMAENCPVGVLIAWMDDKGVPDTDLLSQVGREAYRELETQGGRPRLLFLLAGRQADRYRSLADRIPGCWLWDTENGRLFIYENQPGHFYGLEQMLEQVDRRPRAFVNTAIVIINIAVFLVLELFGSTENISYMVEHGASYAPYIYYGKEYYRLFTAMFLHFGISHLASNMLVLFFLGDNVERALGHWKYLVVYLFSGLAGSGLSFVHAMLSGDYAVSAGASGAIFGVIGALFYIVIRNRGRLEDMTTRKLGFLIFISLYHGITGSGVDNYAHIGGLAGGILSAIVLYCR